MYNDLFTVFGLTVHGYGLMIAIGAMLAFWMITKRAEKNGENGDDYLTLALLVLVLGFLAAKILYIITCLKDFLAHPLSYISGEGFVVYGGILGGALVAVLWSRKHKKNILHVIDLILPPVAFAQGFGRIGCFLAGCCHGKPTGGDWGVVFPAGSMAPAGVPLWPSQLISSGLDFLLGFALLWLEKKTNKRRGVVTAAYFILYSVGRFLVEYTRADFRGNVGVFSTSQFIALFTFAFGVILALAIRRRGAEPGPETEAEPEPAVEEQP